MMVERDVHRGSGLLLYIHDVSLLLRTYQVTIIRKVLAKARDEVGDGPIASV
jgi:hypothetical protein